jgi:CTD small phosphatase-like protein 2
LSQGASNLNLSLTSVPAKKNLKKKKPSRLPKLTKIYYMDKLIEGLSTQNPKNNFYEHFLQSTQSVVYIKSTTQVPEDQLLTKRVYLPPQRSENLKTLIFDLDETLIHCNDEPTSPCDVRVPIRFTGGEIVEAGLLIRPYARKALEILSKHFEIVIFTASHSCYANIVLNLLDPENKFITCRLFREHCIKTKEGIFIKDLRVFANRKLSDLVLVDNAFYSYGYQIENGIPILPFYQNKQDTELMDLVDFLVKIKGVEDLRDAVKKFFMTELYQKYSNRPEILRQMILKQRNKMV